jgi:hypothetical protein
MGSELESQIVEKAGEHQLIEDARRRAAATPLPGALSEAFLNDAIQVADNLFVRRIVASDWKVLQALGSPIYKLILELQKDESIREDISYTDEEEWEMCWQFTHNPKECRELLAKGKDGFRAEAVALGDTLTLPTMKSIVAAVRKHLFDSYLTKVQFGNEETTAEKKT